MIEFFFRFAPCLILIPLFIALRNFNCGLPVKVMAGYLIVSTVSQIVAFSLWYKSANNMPVGHIYTILEFIILSYFYNLLLRDYLLKHLIIYIMTGFVLFAIVCMLFLQSIYEFNTYTSTLSSFLNVAFALLFIIKSSAVITNINTSGFSYLGIINSGFLIYFAGSLVLFACQKYLYQEPRTIQIILWSIHLILLVILYGFLSVGLWRAGKR